MNGPPAEWHAAQVPELCERIEGDICSEAARAPPRQRFRHGAQPPRPGPGTHQHIHAGPWTATSPLPPLPPLPPAPAEGQQKGDKQTVLYAVLLLFFERRLDAFDPQVRGLQGRRHKRDGRCEGARKQAPQAGRRYKDGQGPWSWARGTPTDEVGLQQRCRVARHLQARANSSPGPQARQRRQPRQLCRRAPIGPAQPGPW